MGCIATKETVNITNDDQDKTAASSQPLPVLYIHPASPPCRAALMTAKALGLEVETKLVDLVTGEHRKETFTRVNPQHTLPTLDDNGFILWESRAIETYLATKYGKDDSLYPKDMKKRAVVDQRLYFDATALYPSISAITVPLIFGGERTVPEEKKKKVTAAFELLEGFLASSSWVAGESLTVADIALVATVTTVQATGYDVSQHPKVAAWLERCKTKIPGFADNEQGSQAFGGLVRSLHGGPIFSSEPRAPPVIYYHPASPPSRAALMTAKTLGLEVETKLVDLVTGEHRKETFTRINPQHTVPTLDDNGFILWESRAIETYLATKYGKDDSLYPKDMKKRAVVDQRLYFDATALYPSISAITVPLIFGGERTVPEEKKKKVTAAFELLEGFLASSSWVAGESLTVADIALVATVTTVQATGYDVSQHPKVASWLESCRAKIPGFAENEKGSQTFGELVHSLHGGPLFP